MHKAGAQKIRNEYFNDRAAKQLRMRHLRPSQHSSVRKSQLEQHIPNERSIVEKWRYFVDFLHDFQSFSFQGALCNFVELFLVVFIAEIFEK